MGLCLMGSGWDLESAGGIREMRVFQMGICMHAASHGSTDGG